MALTWAFDVLAIRAMVAKRDTAMIFFRCMILTSKSESLFGKDECQSTGQDCANLANAKSISSHLFVARNVLWLCVTLKIRICCAQSSLIPQTACPFAVFLLPSPCLSKTLCLS